MKKIFLSLLLMCCALGFAFAQDTTRRIDDMNFDDFGDAQATQKVLYAKSKKS
jgi:hypothetical protein